MVLRTAQKNRTRSAILAAARKMSAAGRKVTLASVAKEAGTSRATVYRYFSDPGALAVEATLDIALRPTDAVLDGIEDVRERVHAIASYYLTFTREHEGSFRQFLAQTMRQWSATQKAELRGARRVEAFALALEPVQEAMAPDMFHDLVFRLSMLTGIEQHIAISDVLGLEPAEGDRMQAGLVDALLDKYLPHP